MSDATKTALEEAIRAHLQDEADGETRMLTSWYVVAASVGPEDGTTYYLHVTSDAPWHTLTGLVHLAWRRMSSWTDIEDSSE